MDVIVNFLPTTIGAGLELVSASCPANFTSYCSTWEIGLSDGIVFVVLCCVMLCYVIFVFVFVFVIVIVIVKYHIVD